MAGKTYVLSTEAGPVAAGDLDALKARGEKMVTEIVGATTFRWEKVEEAEDVEQDNRLRLFRKNSASGKWIHVRTYIEEVPLLVDKNPAGA